MDNRFASSISTFAALIALGSLCFIGGARAQVSAAVGKIELAVQSKPTIPTLPSNKRPPIKLPNRKIPDRELDRRFRENLQKAAQAQLPFDVKCRPGGRMRAEIYTYDGAVFQDHADPVYWRLRVEFSSAPEGYENRALEPGECALPRGRITTSPYVLFSRVITARSEASRPWDAVYSVLAYPRNLSWVRIHSKDDVMNEFSNAISKSERQEYPEFHLNVQRQQCRRNCDRFSQSTISFNVIDVPRR